MIRASWIRVASIGAAVGLAGCATSADPSKGGFISGVQGLASGGYQRRVDEQSAELARMREQEAAAKAETDRTNAALADRQRSVDALRDEIAALDRNAAALRSKAHDLRLKSSSLNANDKRLIGNLDAATARLAQLRRRINSGGMEDNYEKTREEYLSLQQAIEVLGDQIKALAKR